MKRILKIALIIIAFASMVHAQSNVGFCALDCDHNRVAAGEPPEYNLWGGSTLNYSWYGDPASFNTQFGLAGKVVLNFFDFGQSDRLHIILFGNLAPARASTNVPVVTAVNSSFDGMSFGIQPYFIYGNLSKAWATTLISATIKNNNFVGASIWTYRFTGGFDYSVFDLNLGSMPVNLSANAHYVVVDDGATFLAVQSEVLKDKYWIFDASVIIPLGGKLGVLFQGDFTKGLAPAFRAGIVLSAGLM